MVAELFKSVTFFIDMYISLYVCPSGPYFNL